jgi:rhodanese-related sulfurtransferase
MPAWKKAGNLVLSEPSYLKDLIEKDIAHVLIDLRSPSEVEKGFIPGAVNIPLNELASAKERFPADKSAPIIIYSETMSEDAFKTVRGWGYKEASALRGGLEAWKQMGGKIAVGDLKTAISYVPKPRPGEISIEEFKMIAENGSPDKVILDVRDVDEAMNGMLKGAINIPAGQIKDRLAELPKGKEIITHCTTGIRAEMAYDDLKENGVKAKFLNAVIQVDKDGKYEITKK